MSPSKPDPLSGLTEPADAQPGDILRYENFPMDFKVIDVKPCAQDGPRSDPHNQYLILDPLGVPDWVCGWDVRKVQ